MSSGVDLLRLLEPAVRPGGLPGPATAPSQPIETRSFDSILEEVKSAGDANSTTNPIAKSTDATEAKPFDPLQALARVDLIDNATLLKLFSSKQTDSVNNAAL